MADKVKKLMASAEFVQKMLSCEEPEQVQALFAENGVEMPLEEIKAIGARLTTLLNNDGGELDEDALEDVAGGIGSNTSFSDVVDVVDRLTKDIKYTTTPTRKW